MAIAAVVAAGTVRINFERLCVSKPRALYSDFCVNLPNSKDWKSKMRDLIIRSIVLLITITMIAAILINPTNNSSAMNVNTDNNPLLAKWEGSYGGIPPFDRVQIPLFKPALEAAMAERLGETEKIANDPAPPDFENTIAALERSGRTLSRVTTLYGNDEQSRVPGSGARDGAAARGFVRSDFSERTTLQTNRSRI